MTPTTFEGFVFNVSEDGSRILMSEERASPSNRYTVVEFINDVHGPLYLRVDGEHTYEIAPGHQIAYVGSTADGKTVYLTLRGTADAGRPRHQHRSLRLARERRRTDPHLGRRRR